MLGIIIPTEIEAMPFLATLPNRRLVRSERLQFVTAKVGSTKIALVISGLGNRRSSAAARFLIDELACSAVFVLGAAGAARPGVRPRTLVAATTVHQRIGKTPRHRRYICDLGLLRKFENFADKNGLRVLIGAVLTQEHWVVSKRGLAAHAPPLAIDMESAGACRACKAAGVRILVLRTITDSGAKAAPAQFLRNVRPAMKALGHAVTRFLSEAPTV